MNATAPVAEAVKGHNKGPLVAPTETDVTESLKENYPSVEKDFDEIIKAAATYEGVELNDEQAAALQALIKKGKQAKTSWKAWRSEEKKPWDGVAKFIYNFFITKEEKLATVLDALNDQLTRFSEKKAEEFRIAAEKKAEEDRRRADELARQAAEAQLNKDWAEALVELAEYDERKARERAANAAEDQMWSEARAELAAYDERKALERKEAREKAEAEQRKKDKKLLTTLNREADKLAIKDQAGTITDDEKDRYRQLIGTHGEIPALQAKLAGDKSHLTAEDRAELEQEEANLQRLRDERVKNHAEAEKAKAEKLKATTEVKTHVKAGTEAAGDARDAGRSAVSLNRQAEKADSSATKAETKAGSISDADASRHRGDSGTTSSLAGRWTHNIFDPRALPAEQLWGLVPDEVKSAAVTKWMRLHQDEWGDKEIVKDALPGVTFTWDTSARVV